MKRSRNLFIPLVLALTVVATWVASSWGAAPANKTVILATTTSTQDSGLLDVLLPLFKKQTGYFVKTISVGSGQAIAMGKKGEADVLLVHSPDDEEKLVEEGYAINRTLVMHNDFIVAGPAGDPAKIRGVKTSTAAFQRIAQSRALFVSRGDKSGTHAKELKIWKGADINPEGKTWYQQTGLGMGETLNVASEKNGYTLADRGTYVALHKKKRLAMEILLEGEPLLLNIYHVMVVNPAKWPKVNLAGAQAFADFLVSNQAQDIIGQFGKDRYGSALFFPDAEKDAKSLGL